MQTKCCWVADGWGVAWYRLNSRGRVGMMSRIGRPDRMTLNNVFVAEQATGKLLTTDWATIARTFSWCWCDCSCHGHDNSGHRLSVCNKLRLGNCWFMRWVWMLAERNAARKADTESFAATLFLLLLDVGVCVGSSCISVHNEWLLRNAKGQLPQ